MKSGRASLANDGPLRHPNSHGRTAPSLSETTCQFTEQINRLSAGSKSSWLPPIKVRNACNSLYLDHIGLHDADPEDYSVKDGGLLHRTIIVLTLLASALSPSSAAGTDLRDYFPYLKTRPITEPAIGEIWSSLVVPQQPTGTEITLANNALILSGKQAAFRTLDGGKSWNLLGLDPTTLIAMSSLFAIAATDSEVYLTSDRGTSWQVVT